MKKLLYLTDGFNKNLIPDEKGIIEVFKSLEVELDIRIWDEVDWKTYENILIRTPWDYSKKKELFLSKLNSVIERNLINPKSIVEWNMDKSYLKELYQKGFPVIETEVCRNFKLADLDSLFKKYETLVVKPLVGAGGINTFLVTKDSLNELGPLLNFDVIIQPFIPSIKTLGEISLIYFDGEFSHSVIKTAKEDEFRIQDDHGGSVQSYNPSLDCIKTGHQILSSVGEKLAYARVDLVKDKDSFLLMELELIEPELFFRFSTQGMNIFAKTIKSRLS